MHWRKKMRKQIIEHEDRGVKSIVLWVIALLLFYVMLFIMD
jgi:hypothetical protein